ncbi:MULTISPECIES: extracellular solute-binding protein [unclassified Chelatococcus]|uniref:extracellular solute-binding protein n=1 Tax=unclassified Chelatococcus TaxID=2638111 RepID=UPI001BCEA386|nr:MULTISPECIES: extracellular solute-binding protein [unclassified Chelatococcus]MBS7740957.1 extracellular solute-binding protein [Chelatococcus sp. HY11]MBX3546752.1 extracellular solute-binding protein [Chelatococcus sp.]MCO5077777.1 extracellular solute-binding protein [Chelatococcus sp.]
MSNLTRRAALLGGSGLVASAALPQAPKAQEQAPITVTCYGGAFEKTVREKIIPRFEAEHPYKIRLVVTDDADIVAKLVVARGKPPFDAIMINHETAIMLNEAGLLLGDQSSKLSHAGEIYESMMPPKCEVYGTTIYKFDLVYRKVAFESPPTSWRDLWRPGLAVGVPYVGQPYGLTFLYLAAVLNGGSATNLNPGFAAIRRLPKFKIYNNVGQGLQLFQQQEIDAAFYYAHRGEQLIALGLPVARAQPHEGVYAQRTGTQIPKGTRNLAGALAWTDFTLSAGYQAPLVEQFYSPANKTVAIPADKTANFTFGDEAVAQLLDPPWHDLMPQRDALLDQWRKEIG